MPCYDTTKMKGWADTFWPQQKEIIDSLVVYTDTLIAFLEREIDFINDEYSNLENFIKNKLRSIILRHLRTRKKYRMLLKLYL